LNLPSKIEDQNVNVFSYLGVQVDVK